MIARFDLQKTIFYYQNDRLIVLFLLPATGFLLYMILHRFRWGFSFTAAQLARSENHQIPRRWVPLFFLGFIMSLNIGISLYFHSHFVLPMMLGYACIGATLWFLCYRRELSE
ncbi:MULTISPECIES: hypothetical protein [unclassified Paenibacillus]|uniref:hypothetical protein n=1 Tax=unclassified Paenibacillus TaxID=185978 RepID=UPI00115F7D74|nr:MULTISPECIES: hypothetical protein [unclassified Paenibacillus]